MRKKLQICNNQSLRSICTYEDGGVSCTFYHYNFHSYKSNHTIIVKVSTCWLKLVITSLMEPTHLFCHFRFLKFSFWSTLKHVYSAWLSADMLLRNPSIFESETQCEIGICFTYKNYWLLSWSHVLCLNLKLNVKFWLLGHKRDVRAWPLCSSQQHLV